VPDLEVLFGDFIDGKEYEGAQDELLSVVRLAYIAGWIAAGGKPPTRPKIIALDTLLSVRTQKIDPNSIKKDQKPKK
jgi:hypothetical protein